MERLIDPAPADRDWEERAVGLDDTAASRMLASGQPVHIVRPTTPEGFVTRIYPDGREELIRVDLAEAARLLGN